MNPVGFIFAAGEAGEILLGGYLLRYSMDWSQGFHTIQQMRRGWQVALIAPIVGASLGTFAITVSAGFGVIPVSKLAWIFFRWWLRSVIGFVVLAPMIGAWNLRPKEIWGPNKVEGLIVTACTIGISLFCFSDFFGLVPAPIWLGLLAGFFLVWSGSRCGIFLTTHLSVFVLGAASFAALNQSSIISRIAEGDLRVLWWFMLNLCALGGITLSVLNARAVALSRNISAARNRLELLVRNSPLALVEWDLNFHIRVWSRKAEDIFGYSQDVAVGASGMTLLVPVEDRIRVSDQWLQVLGGEKGVRTTNHNLTASGETILCDWYGSPIFDERDRVVGMVAMVEDVTDREAAKIKLQQSEQRFQTVAEVIPQAISYYSVQMECLYGNPAFFTSNHLSDTQLPLHVSEMVTPEDWERIFPNLEKVCSGIPVSFLEVMRMPDGEIHDLDRSLLPDIDATGKVRGFFSVCTDITQYRIASEEKIALETQILQTQKLESLSLLSGKIAHEFNNRLCGILGHADMARQDLRKDPGQAVEALDRAIRIAREASELCRQLFVYSGFGTGEKVLAEVKPFVLDIRRLLELTLPRHIRLRTSFEESLPPVLLDLAQVRQAIVNLVQNAAQALGEKRGEVWVGARLVRASEPDFMESFLALGPTQGDLVEIYITDDGEGIPEQEVRQNFEPFFTRRPGSRGLGLSGVLGIVHGHSGAIAVESSVGKGTAVKLYFPVAKQVSNLNTAFTNESKGYA